MEWTENNRYEASWGAIYVQIKFENNQMVELKFNHNPTNEEIEPIAQKIWESMQAQESTIILEAEDGETQI